jgi:hypothetical protein
VKNAGKSLLNGVKNIAIFTGVLAGGAAIAATMSLGAAGVGTLLAGTMTAALATKVAIIGGSLGAAGALGGMTLFGFIDGISSPTGQASPWRAYRGAGLTGASLLGAVGAVASFTMGCISEPAVKTSLNDLDAGKDFNRVAVVHTEDAVRTINIEKKLRAVLKA